MFLVNLIVAFFIYIPPAFSNVKRAPIAPIHKTSGVSYIINEELLKKPCDKVNSDNTIKADDCE